MRAVDPALSIVQLDLREPDLGTPQQVEMAGLDGRDVEVQLNVATHMRRCPRYPRGFSRIS